MSVPVWCADLAAGFWAAAGDPPPFPRDLRDAASLALRFSVIDLPRLRVAAVRAWFAGCGVAVPLDEPDRPLRACLVAWLGEGFAFIEAGDDAAERRFSVAHEVGHFLRDYWQPRETAVARLGPGVLAVLDGLRRATPEERLHALLRNVPVGPFAHLLRRDESGRPLTFAERESESAADRLAFELLAPAGAVVGEPVSPSIIPARHGQTSSAPLPLRERAARLGEPGEGTPSTSRETFPHPAPQSRGGPLPQGERGESVVPLPLRERAARLGEPGEGTSPKPSDAAPLPARRAGPPSPAAGGGERTAARLVRDFGLPPGPAARYAAILAPGPVAANKLLGRLLTPGVARGKTAASPSD